MTSNRSKDWEKEFDKQIEQDLLGNKPRELCLGCYECGKEISIEGVKSFIQSLLDQQRAELIEKVEGLITEYTPDDYNTAVGDVINLLKEEHDE